MKTDELNLTIAHGGKAIYGARLGILMLEARFPRIPGDVGHSGTWPFPVLYKVVKGASPQRVVAEKAQGLLPDFVASPKRALKAWPVVPARSSRSIRSMVPRPSCDASRMVSEQWSHWSNRGVSFRPTQAISIRRKSTVTGPDRARCIGLPNTRLAK